MTRKRQRGKRRLKNIIYVATEGSLTEKMYIDILNKNYPTDSYTIKVSKRRRTKSSPLDVLKALKNDIKDDFRKDDFAVVIIDKDNWDTNALEKLQAWKEKDKRHRIIVSNPCFELWLLLHFEYVSGTQTNASCNDRLKKHLPNYNKGIPHFDKSQIKEAVKRARTLSAGKDLLMEDFSGTNMYELIDLLESLS